MDGEILSIIACRTADGHKIPREREKKNWTQITRKNIFKKHQRSEFISESLFTWSFEIVWGLTLTFTSIRLSNPNWMSHHSIQSVKKFKERRWGIESEREHAWMAKKELNARKLCVHSCSRNFGRENVRNSVKVTWSCVRRTQRANRICENALRKIKVLLLKCGEC